MNSKTEFTEPTGNHPAPTSAVGGFDTPVSKAENPLPPVLLFESEVL